MKNFISGITTYLSPKITAVKHYAVQHKLISAIFLVVVLGGGWWTYSKLTATSTETRYALSTVSKGTVVASLSGSGQVSTSNQLEIKPKASGEIVAVNVAAGQQVSAGQLIAVIDPTNAQKAVRDAEVSLESAKISLQKLTQAADTLSRIQTENALAQAQSDLIKGYDDGFSTVSNTFLDLPAIMSGLQDILYGVTVGSGSQENISAYADMVKNYDDRVFQFKDDAANKYKAARTAYDDASLQYKTATRFSSTSTIESLVSKTYDSTKTIAEAVKSTSDLLNFVKDTLIKQQRTVPTILTTHQTTLSTQIGKVNTDLLNLYSSKKTISTSIQDIAERTESLAKLVRGADPLDVSSQQLTVTQRQNALVDAQNSLGDYYVRAPFAGTIAALSANKYDTAGSGTSLATLITNQKIAELSLNEVDAAKTKVGDKVTLTFDAIDGLSLTGSVAEIDAVGTVTQGVVNYKIKIGFDTQDARIKPGMTVNAAIIIAVHADVLTVPASAVKTQNGQTYVQVFNPALPDSGSTQGVTSSVAPTSVPVEVGISDDLTTEIISGVTLGEQVVSRTITGTAAAATAQAAPSLFGGGATRTTGTGNVQIRRN